MNSRKLFFKFALLLMIAMGFTLSACSERHLEEVHDQSPIAQLDMTVPGADLYDDVLDCGCSAPPPRLGTAMQLDYVPGGIENGMNPGFSATVTHVSDCDMRRCEYSSIECQCIGRRYYLSFNQNYSLSDFQDIEVTKLNGQPLSEAYFMPDGDGIYATQPFKAKFIWTDSNAGNPMPTNSEITDGGICIIGIVTDPRPPLEPRPIGINQ